MGERLISLESPLIPLYLLAFVIYAVRLGLKCPLLGHSYVESGWDSSVIIVISPDLIIDKLIKPATTQTLNYQNYIGVILELAKNLR